MAGFSARLTAIAAMFGALMVSPLANTVGAHVLRGTETWVHVAGPGVEVGITVSDAETARSLGLGEGSDDPTNQWAAAWRVAADGEPCPVEAGSAALTRKGGHLRFAARYSCGVNPRKLELTPVFLTGAEPRMAHMARVLIGDRLAPFDLNPKAEPIVLNVGELLQSWNIALSPDYLGSRN